MGTVIFTTQITRKYLMGKSKYDMADFTLWILDMKQKEFDQFSALLDRIAAHLDEDDGKGAMAEIIEWDNNHKPWDRAK